MSDIIKNFSAKPPCNFNVTFSEELEKIDSQKSKGRVRIFYREQNRNGTYITEEFANYLLQSLPGTPVVGEYDSEKGDFTQHTGIEATKSYGFVPPNPNFAWETHLDPDGVERDYACADVILWTGRYQEASEIIGKQHSMELDPDTIDGNWKIERGLPIFTFTKAEFFGLCILGDDVSPCFEGSSFYALEESKKELIKQLREEYKFNLKLFETENNKGGDLMAYGKINFKLSHGDIYNKIWDAVNPNYNEDGGWAYTAGIVNVYDDYALIREYNDEGKSYRVTYTKNADDTISVGEKTEVFIVDVTAEEYAALQYIKEINGGSYTNAENSMREIEAFKEANPEFDFADVDFAKTKKDEDEDDDDKDEDDEDFKKKKGNCSLEDGDDETGTEDETAEFAQQIAALTEENIQLKEYKANKEMEEKKAILNSYSERLEEEVIAEFTEEKLAELTSEQLEKELAYTLVKATDFSLVAKNKIPNGGIETESEVVRLLRNYTI